MAEAIADTGVILHLHEIAEESVLGLFDRILLPRGVRDELAEREIPLEHIAPDSLPTVVEVVVVEEEEWRPVLAEQAPRLQLADVQVLALSRRRDHDRPVLTDDLALRRQVEKEGGVAVGTLGLLFRAYREGRFDSGTLRSAVDRLLSESTLHLGKAFRNRILQMTDEVVGSDSRVPER